MAVSLCESMTTRMRDGRILGYGRWGDEDEGEGHAVDYRRIDEILATLAAAFNGR
jgi:hypothetical protein